MKPSLPSLLRSRTAFLLGLGLGTTGLVLAALPAIAANRATIGSSTVIPYIDGAAVGGVRTVDMVDSQTATGVATGVTMTVTGGPSFVPLATWAGAAIAGRGTMKPVEIDTLDANMKVSNVRMLSSTWIQEFDFPPLDAASKDTALFTVRLSPASSTFTTGGGNGALPSAKYRPTVQSNFRLQIDGVDCSRAVKIGALTAQFSQPSLEGSGKKASALEKGGVKTTATFSNLIVTVLTSGAGATGLQQFEQMLADHASRNGAIQYLEPDLKGSLCTATFSNLAVTKISSVAVTGADTTSRSQVEMTVGGVQFSCASGN